MGSRRLLIAPEEGEQIQLFPGLGAVFKIEGHETGGAFSVVEHQVDPRTLVIPHVHEREDEFSYVLEGEIGVRIGDQALRVEAGSYVLKPCGIPHTFWNPTDQPARLLEIISPAGFEQFFREVAPLLAGPGEPDTEAMDDLDAQYGLGEQLGQMDWIPDLIQRYGLNSPM